MNFQHAGAETTMLSDAQRVVVAIKDGLEAGKLVPGQRLIEADLCLRFGVRRTQVREALHRLSSENIVELLPNKGAVIRSMSSEQAAGAIEAIELLIGLVARSAARHFRDHSVRAKLAGALAELDPGLGGRETLRARRRIYEALIDAARNEELARILGSLQYHVLQVQYLLPRLHEQMNDDLRDIVDAVLAGEQDTAEQRARTHIRRMHPADPVNIICSAAITPKPLAGMANRQENRLHRTVGGEGLL